METNETIVSFQALNFDFIIIGAGAAGATIAGQLVQNPEWKILLIEAGGDALTESVVSFNLKLKLSGVDNQCECPLTRFHYTSLLTSITQMSGTTRRKLFQHHRMHIKVVVNFIMESNCEFIVCVSCFHVR